MLSDKFAASIGDSLSLILKHWGEDGRISLSGYGSEEPAVLNKAITSMNRTGPDQPQNGIALSWIG